MACRSFAVLLICTCLGIVSGCGGEDEPPVPATPTTPADPVDETPANDSPGEGETSTKEDDQKPEEGAGEPEGEDEKEPEPEPELPKRPDEVSNWKPADYITAKKERDRKLPDAVVFLSKPQYEGNEKVAQVLVQLLINEADPDQKEPEDGQPVRKLPPIQVSRTVAMQIVNALGKSKTPVAEKALRDLIMGKLETPLNSRRAIPAVLQTMAENSVDYAPYEDLLYTIVISATEVVKKSRLSDLKPAQLQASAGSAISSTKNESIRLRLARHLEDPQVSRETAQVIESLLVKDVPENLLAQIVLYRNLRTEKRTRSRIEATLAHNSTRAMELLLGIPEKLETPPPPGTLSRPSVHDGKKVEDHREQYFRFARAFWTPDLLDYFDGQIKKDGPGVASIPLSFLGSVPRPEARFMMSELLSFYAFEGSRAWRSANMLGKSTTDPGFIVLAKRVYQRTSLRRGTVIKPDENRPRVEEDKRDAWQLATQGMVTGWFQRCYSAARKANPPMKSETAEDEMKIHLHPSANIVAQYHIHWPADAQSSFPDIEIAPLKMHYYRIEEEGFVEKLVARYQRYAGKGGKGKTHKLRGSQWLDGLVNGLEPHSKRSVDIQISGKEESELSKTPGGEVKPGPVVIEILTVEIPEPKAPPKDKVTRRSN